MRKILIIEDDADINDIIAEALTKAGYTCTQAYSGTEAMLYLDKETYALAVMDLMLPGLSGEKLLPKLKEKQSIPVIVVSAKDSLDSNEIEINQVFSRFYKADSARSNNSTGLGLSIAKELVEHMNGNIEAGIEDDLFVIKIKFHEDVGRSS